MRNPLINRFTKIFIITISVLMISSCSHILLNKLNIFEGVALKGVRGTVYIKVIRAAGPGVGSGTIIDQDGHIITNNHIVEDAININIVLSNGDEYKAELVGTDPKTDIALLKVVGIFNIGQFVPFKLGDSDRVRVGSRVIAIGNPFGLNGSVTSGIVSGLDRSMGIGYYDMYIQTDASINPGNSGGPLINLKGEVIGINALILTTRGREEERYNTGIGFAIPINVAKDVVVRLKKDGKVIRSSLGVMVQEITSKLQKEFNLNNRKGVLVTNVVKDSAAEEGGMKREDIIIGFGGKRISGNISRFSYMVGMTPVGKKVKIIIIRDGKERELVVKLRRMEEPELKKVKPSKTEKSFGISAGPITPQLKKMLSLKDKEGVVILNIKENSSAYWSGLKKYDIIIIINHKSVKDIGDYNKIMKEISSKQQVLIVAKRGNSAMYIMLRRK